LGEFSNPAFSDQAPAASQPLTGAPDVKDPPDTKLKEGDKVLHAKWGEGVIIGKREKDNETEYQVAFASGGIKKLLAQYAPLKKI
jgi:hypothetical protein